MTDPIKTLHKLAKNFRTAEQKAKESRAILNGHIQQMKLDGYTFPELAKESGLAQGTIQNIIADDPRAPQYWRKRCTRKPVSDSYCDEVWVKATDEWCDSCRQGLAVSTQSL